MKIAWGKFGAPITYGYDELLGTAGGVNMNSRYIRQLMELGHEVFPIVPLTRKSEPWPDADQQPIQEADVVIVENGPNSLLSAFKGTPAITYLLAQLAQYTGPVIYLQSDPDLPFSFFPENFTPAYYGGGPHSAGLQKEYKEWFIVTSCRNLDQLVVRCSGRRYQYNNVAHMPNVKFRTVELHDVLADEDLNFEDSTKFSRGAYIGGERRLCKKFVEYSRHYTMDLYGKWKDANLARLGDKVKYHGIAPDGSVYRIYQAYPHSLVMGNKDYEDVGMVAARFWETSMSGCLPLLDTALPDPSGGLAVRVTPEFIAEEASISPEDAKARCWEIRKALISRNATLGPVMQRVLDIIK